MTTFSNERAKLGKKRLVQHTVKVLTLIALFGLLSVFSSNGVFARPDTTWLGSSLGDSFTITNQFGNGLSAHSTTINKQFTDGQIITTRGVDCDGNTFFNEQIIYNYCFECWCIIANGEANFNVEATANIEIYLMHDIDTPKLLHQTKATPGEPVKFILPSVTGKGARYLIKYSDPNSDATHSEKYYVPVE